MADDIVTRLRAEICECGYSESFKELHKCLNCEAADEIERLRAEVKALKLMISPAPNLDYRYFVHPDAASTYAQLLRGEFNG